MSIPTLGIVGAGDIVRGVHVPVLAAMRQKVRVAYVADVNERAARTSAKLLRCAAESLNGTGLQRLPETDLVLIAIPVGVRGPYYREFAERGTLVVAEKPPATSSAELVELGRLFGTHRMAVFLQRRTYLSTLLVESVTEHGLFGRLQRIEVAEGSRQGRSGGKQQFLDDVTLSGGGILMDLGVHSLDLAVKIADSNSVDLLDASAKLDSGIDHEVHLSAVAHRADGDVQIDAFFSWTSDLPGTTRYIYERATLVTPARPSETVWVEAPGGAALGSIVGPPRLVGATTIFQACSLLWSNALESYGEGRIQDHQPASFTQVARLIDEAYGGIRR